MIKAVLDTNVLFSGVVHRGLPHRILAAAKAQLFVVVISPYIVTEFSRVTRRAFGPNDPEVANAFAQIVRIAEVAPVFSASGQWCLDPCDDAVVETALVSNAGYLVTGDRALLTARAEGVAIVVPSDFARIIGIQ